MIKIREEDYNTIDLWDSVYKDEHNQNLLRTNDPIWNPFVKHIGENVKIIDIGCGTGGFLKFINALRPFCYLAGLERSLEGVNYAKEVCNRAKFYNNFDEINEFYDVAVCSEVLEHIPANADFMQLIINVVKVGGLIITTTPYKWNYAEKLHVWDYETKEDILNLTNGRCVIHDSWTNNIESSDMCVVLKRVL